MTSALERKIVLVTRRTRLEELIARHHTVAQAKFYIEHLDADFGDYEREHNHYLAARQTLLEVLEQHGRYQAIDRAYLANFLFGKDDVVIALGQDGLVANTMKYLDGHALVGVNPEAARHDGLLLPFQPGDVAKLLPDLLADRRPSRDVTMAVVTLNDQQTLHAVNDLFIGPKSHTSARYEIIHDDRSEMQSSSGIIVSTGLGSTAWMRSVVTGSSAIINACQPHAVTLDYQPLPWDADQLQFAVREPFPSKTTRATLVYGRIAPGQPLRLRSLMPENGTIFSDGMESDCLAFNAGTQATIDIADNRGRLII